MTGTTRVQSTNLPPELLSRLLIFQRGEITEYHIYGKLAALQKNPKNREVLLRMAEEEYAHYRIWKRYTGKDLGPERPRVWFYSVISVIFGLTFGIKLMEKRENDAILTYSEISPLIPDAKQILRQEAEHELAIIGMIDEKGLRYIGSVVLGINDALVEFTGSLAGFTFALQDTRIIAAVGFIMGIAAALSMGASEYLSQKSEGSANNPVTAAFYTGGAYLVTVIVLVLPFILMTEPLKAYVITLTAAILIIVLFTFYTSVAKDLPFWKRFIEMAGISLGIAAVSFAVGILIRMFLQVNV
jgi:VIT1/CCC1 family predicted Fe2+/Mn2+ transporter